ncbi:DSS1/SEM1 family [Geosmithia morbida]|uniref:26S proteasome complex subunit SEM1 n=1 Tax=Geosmithia morbida TaxID=1094350 RepID=A0A9P4YUW3_9HYPO|nr:DSS1/SEM1 family [Geosmithia morbida]KAF4122257.1 DSS1/SEM1 family [Geosmithia morbida]
MASEDTKPTEAVEQKQQEPTKPALGEDDEFEDFPVDDWPEDQTEAAAQQDGDESKHLWDESWDDDDTNDDFSNQLRYRHSFKCSSYEPSL